MKMTNETCWYCCTADYGMHNPECQFYEKWIKRVLISEEDLEKIKRLYIDSYSDFTPQHYETVIEELYDGYRALKAELNRVRIEKESILQAISDPENQPSQYGTVLASVVQGRTEALEFVSHLIEDWREFAKSQPDTKMQDAINECADQLEKQIENFSTFC